MSYYVGIHLSDEDTDMDRPVVEAIVSDIVGYLAHKSYILQLNDSLYYHYTTDKIYELVTDRPALPG